MTLSNVNVLPLKRKLSENAARAMKSSSSTLLQMKRNLSRIVSPTNSKPRKVRGFGLRTGSLVQQQQSSNSTANNNNNSSNNNNNRSTQDYPHTVTARIPSNTSLNSHHQHRQQQHHQHQHLQYANNAYNSSLVMSNCIHNKEGRDINEVHYIIFFCCLFFERLRD